MSDNNQHATPENLHVLGAQFLGAIREKIRHYQHELFLRDFRFEGPYEPKSGKSIEVPLDDGLEAYFLHRKLAGKQVAQTIAGLIAVPPGLLCEYTISFKRHDSQMVVSKDGKIETICRSGYYHWSIKYVGTPGDWNDGLIDGGGGDGPDLPGDEWKKA